ncbi:MAG: M48 family metalloprotease [Candidatus Bathyarchaeota archaeon]|nr:M48 family metalloprotease [Candidatus Bathyarchaeota archaeon]
MSVIVLGVSYLMMRVLRLNNPRVRSIYFGLALLAPIILYVLFTPLIWVTRIVMQHSFTPFLVEMNFDFERVVEVNYVGVICVVGLILGGVTFLVSNLFSLSIVKRMQGVVEVGVEEEPTLYEMVEKVARKMGVDTPRVGLTEHLQPNAFTVGRGKSAMVVFTMGILSALDPRELEAVAAHELAHIKNGDFNLMSFVTALKIVFFYNPVSYLAASMVSREREYLADEVGAKAISRTRQLKSALVKISAAKTGMSQNLLTTLTTRLFVYSQIGSLKAAFAAHPNVDTRLRHIGGVINWRGDAVKTAAVAVLLVSTLFLAGGYIFQPMRLVDQLLFRVDNSFGLRLMKFPEGRGPIAGAVVDMARIAPPLDFKLDFRVEASLSLIKVNHSSNSATQHLLTEDAVRLAGVAADAVNLPPALL